jgi:hypothetical protein
VTRTTRNRRWTIAGVAALLVLAAAPVIAATTGDRAEAAVAVPGDGTTSTTAGASCWGIKTQQPSSPSGIYWLYNAAMDRPAQFACDMTTDGGGWVLVGRGRNGWTFANTGQGSAATVRTTIDGSGAFAPATLDTPTVLALLGGSGSDLRTNVDGIRLRRATTANGSGRQEIRLRPAYRTWTWTLPAGQLLDRIVIDGTTYAGGNTKDTAGRVQGQTVNALTSISDKRRIWTFASTGKNNQQGFGLGSGVGGGSNAASNYLYTYQGETSPLGFTQVWLRPRIANSAAGFTPIPAAGLPAQPKPDGLKNRSELAAYGVVGADHTNEEATTPWYSSVLDVQALGSRVFVGGRFTGVRKGPTGAISNRPYLAAFDLSGNWISTFKPTFDGRVWAMAVSSTGKLIVGGDFTKVNGVAKAGLVVLDPITGAIDPSFTGTVGRVGRRAVVRSLTVRGTTLYVGGRFNRASGGTARDVVVSSAIDFDTRTGTPGSWKPVIHASPLDLTVSNDGKRVLMSGYFAAVNGDTNMGYWGIVSATTGAVSAGYGKFRPSIGSEGEEFQFASTETPGGKLVTGGSEHSLQLYDSKRTTLLDSHITKAGGDFQVAEMFGNVLYAGCHCVDWDYQGTNDWLAPSGFRSIDPIRFIARYDPETLALDTSWYPNGLKGQYDDGVWTLSMDKNRCLWFGGDFVRGAYSGVAATDYLGGFGRFCPLDTTPPTTPTAFKATRTTTGASLSWAASSDSGTVSYDVYRDDRVIATTYGTSYVDPLPASSATARRYTVRAADARGNRSAAPAPIAVDGAAPVASTPIPMGSTWRYQDKGTNLGTAWKDPATAVTTWSSGKAPLGWGTTQATTVGPTKPTTTYYRQSFTVTNPSALKTVAVDLRMSQGAVVYLNGLEIGRANMPAGTVTSSTVAAAWIGGTDNNLVRTFTVPASLLKTGTNTVAVEVHGWRPQSGVTIFDAAVRLIGASTLDTTPPTKPTAKVAAATGGLRVTWTAATDNRALGGYLVARDGTTVGVAPVGTTSFVDTVSTSAKRTYVVTAFDTAGNLAPSSAAVFTPTVASTTTTTRPATTTTTTRPATTTTTVPLAATTTVLGFGSTWRWTYPTTPPAASWNAPGFADSAWASGRGRFGFGDGTATTVISTTAAPRPLTSYYRTTVTVANPAAFRSFTLDLVRNAGAVVYVNGVEVGRSNLPAGPIDASTYASSAPSKDQRDLPVTLSVPTSAFRAGSNTIAVEVHLNWRSQPTAGFDLRVTGQGR